MNDFRTDDLSIAEQNALADEILLKSNTPVESEDFLDAILKG